jgi:hypothetical protein
MKDVRLWHLADSLVALSNVHFWGFAQAKCAMEEYYETGIYLLAETIADAPNMRCST